MTRALSILDLELAARPCMNPASILWPAWPDDARRQATAATRRREREAPLWFFNAPELNPPEEI